MLDHVQSAVGPYVAAASRVATRLRQPTVAVALSDAGGYARMAHVPFVADPRAEMDLVKVYPERRYQRIIGFGGAFTDAAASVYAQLDADDKALLLAFLFSPEGLGYTLCRTPIQSCDYSRFSYDYVP